MRRVARRIRRVIDPEALSGARDVGWRVMAWGISRRVRLLIRNFVANTSEEHAPSLGEAVRRWNVVPTIGWPAKGSAPDTVKISMDTALPLYPFLRGSATSSGSYIITVSERLNSRAIVYF
jgi:hypothetical protein